jgi:hypothetical protein
LIAKKSISLYTDLMNVRLFLLLALVLAACSEKPKGATADSTAPPMGNLPVGTKVSPGSVERPAALRGDSHLLRRIVPLDTANGSVTLTATEPVRDAWVFDDVTASTAERAGNGSTQTVLTLEAHQSPPDHHFKIRLSRTDGELTTGSYTTDGESSNAPRSLDATWEYGGEVYKALPPGTGTVNVTALTNDRVRGTYDLTLVSLSTSHKRASLRGTFDVRRTH